MAFLKTERPKQFTYVPVYYDKRKEELDAQIARVRKERPSGEEGEYTPNFKGQFRKRHEAIWGAPIKKSNNIGRWLMLIIYAGLVVTIVYLILNILTSLQ